ncbi:S-layer homology domain-containing protein [Butyricicoccus sp. Marseille-Q5471]|uniref:S-layer homology domain-containing protein n=1 Tax=Butyricicoccus sp. Marseille-Q5471 TaxID=3039493 RepID=UPI0024BCBD1F|nr:S-layer homology domain-containing protein [Butyricicoccus sp. Marseille-Q5471]
MKKLCRLTSTLLAVLMCGMIAAGAASSSVERVQEAGFMSGYSDGQFHAEDVVTRAQMAQIIYTMKNNTTDASAYAKLTSSFTDISGHWAVGAIKYCAASGVIRGKTATAFAPDDSVTGLEAAKMLLVGYLGKDPTKEGLNGARWSQNTKTLGNQAELFAQIDGALDEPISRGSVAQMICNALDAK